MTLLLLRDGVGLSKSGLRVQGDRARQLRIFRRGLPVPARLAGLGDELADGAYGDLHLLVAEDHRAQHHVLRQALRLRLHHEDAVLRGGDDEVQLRLGELLGGGIEEVLAVLPADAGGADRAAERDTGEGERRGSAEERGNVRIDLRIDRQHRRDDLHFVVEAVRKERTDRPVDEARSQRLLLGRTALTLEEAARDASRGIGLLHVVDGEGKEIAAGGGRRSGARGDQHHGIAHRDLHGTFGLAGDFARLDGDRLRTVLK